MRTRGRRTDRGKRARTIRLLEAPLLLLIYIPARGVGLGEFDSQVSLQCRSYGMWVSVRVARDHCSLSLARHAVFLFFFFFSKGFKLVKFDYFFLLTLCYFWKIFCVILQRLLYWFSLRGSPRDMETHKDLFLWLLYREKESIITRRHRGWHHSHGRKRKKKSPFLRLCRESVSLDPRQLTPRILSWAYIHTQVCVCDTYLSLSLDGYC